MVKRKILAGLLCFAMLFQQAGTVVFAQEDLSEEVLTTEENEESSMEVSTTEEDEESFEEVLTTEEDEESSEEVLTTEEDEESSEEVLTTEEDEESSEEVLTTEEDEESSEEAITVEESEELSEKALTTDENEYADMLSDVTFAAQPYCASVAGSFVLPDGYVICDSTGVVISDSGWIVYAEQYNAEDVLIGRSEVWTSPNENNSQEYIFYGDTYNYFESAVSSKLVVFMKPSESDDSGEDVIKVESTSIQHKEGTCTVAVSHTESGVSTLHLSAQLSGIESWMEVSVSVEIGTEEDENSWTAGSIYCDSDSKSLEISNLKGKTTYYGKIKLYLVEYNDLTGESENIMLGNTTFGPLTTKEDKELTLTEVFPDEVFRAAIVSNAGLSSTDTTISLSKLESITELCLDRTGCTENAIKSIEGIEYLANLQSLSLANHEISSFKKTDETEIDWSNFKNLSSLNLSGNDLTEFPDLSGLPADCIININKNKIDSIKNLSEKLPPNYEDNYMTTIISSLSSSQRTGDPSVTLSDMYYAQGENHPFFAIIKNLKSLDYSYEVYINDTKTEDFTVEGNYLKITDCGIEGGAKVKVLVKAGEEAVAGTEKEVTFAEDIPYAKELYVKADAYSTSLTGYIPGSVTIVDSQLITKDEKIAAVRQNGTGGSYSSSNEVRYLEWEQGNFIGGWNNTVIYGNLYWVISPEAGETYSWKITYKDSTDTEQTVVFSDCVKVADCPVVTKISGYTSANNYDDYWYAYVSGVNLDPSNLTVEIYLGKDKISEKAVEWKLQSDGYIVKLEKAQLAKDFGTGDYTYKIQSSDPNVIIDIESEDDIFLSSSPLYYATYNAATKKIEAYFDSRVPDGTSLEIEIKNSYLESSSVLATAIANVKNGKAELTAYDAEGKEISWSSIINSTNYLYMSYTVNGQAYSLGKYTYVNTYTSNITNSYISSRSILQEGFTNFVVEGYCANGTKNGNYQFAVINENSEKVSTCTIEEVIAGTAGVYVDAKIGITGIEAGNYTLQFLKDNTVITEKTLQVVSKDMFRLTNQFAAWYTDDLLGVYLTTPLSYENYEKFTVKITDVNGNEISGIKVEDYLHDKYFEYADYGALLISGLSKKTADNMYYIHVTYNGDIEPQKADGTAYYADEKGEFEHLGSSSHCSTYSNTDENGVSRLNGIYFDHMDCIPATLNIYAPNDTTLLKSIIINSSNMYYNLYYFTESDLEGLNKDSIYDVIVTTADGYCLTQDDTVLGVYEQQNTLRVSKSSISLTVNDEEKQKDSFTVTGYTGKVTVTGSNPAVAAVTKTEADNVCTVTVTAVSNGSANIIVTNAGNTYTIPVTVSSKPEAVVMNKSSLTLNGIGAQQQLSVSVSPKEAATEDLTVAWSSDKPEIASVDENGIVTAVGVGDAVITAKCDVDGIEFEATCAVTVKGTVTEEELKSAIQGLGTLQIVTNAGDALSDELFGDKAYNETTKEGFSWKAVDGNVPVVSADSSNPVQKISAVYKKADYEEIETTLPVSVSQVTGIHITGDTLLVKEENAGTELGVELVTVGAEIDEDLRAELMSVTWTSKKGVVSIENNNAFNTKVTPIQTGKDTVTAVVTFNNTTVKKGKTQFTCTYNIEVTEEPVVNGIKVAVLDSETTNIPNVTAKDDITEINLDKEQLVNKKNTIALSATAYIADKDTEVPLTWSSSDKSVAEVKLVNKQPVLTVKKAGVAEITVTAKDKGKFAVSIPVCVKDYAPIFTDKTLTLNAYAVDGIEFTALSAYANEITAVSVYEKDGKNYRTEASANFKVEKKDDTTYTLSIISGSDAEKATKKQTVSCMFRFTTQNGSYEYPVKVVVEVKKPTAQLKAVNKLNVFYTDSVAAYTVNSKYPIESVEWESSASETDDVKIGTYSYSDSVLYLNCLDEQGNSTVTNENYKKLLDKNYSGRKGIVKVKFAGYKDSAMMEVPLTVAVENKAPKLTTAEKETVLCPSQGLTGSEIFICENNEKLDLTSEYQVSTDTKDVTVALNEGKVAVNYKGSKSVKAKLELQKDNWTQKAVITHKLNVVKQPQLVLSKTTIVLNKNTTVQENAPIIIDLSIKNNSAEVKNLTRTASGNKNIQLLSDGILSMTYDEFAQQLRIGLNKTAISKITKDGSYKISFGGTMKIKGTEVKLAPAALMVKLSTKDATASVKAKGSINLLERESTYIEYTPVIGNMDSEVVKAELISNDEDKFDVELNESGKICVRAKTGALLKANTKYSAKFKFTLENGYEVISKAFVIKPIQKNPKLVTNLKKVTMYHAEPVTCNYAVSIAQSNSTAQIAGLEVVPSKYTENFEYTDCGNGIMNIKLKENSTLKAGNYSVTFKVHFTDEASNVKNTTVKLSITVK